MQTEWDTEVYQAMMGRALKWFPGDHELAHDAAVDRWLEYRERARGRLETREAKIGWCLRFLKQRYWHLRRLRRTLCDARTLYHTFPLGILERNTTAQTKRREAIYQSLLKLRVESRVLLERWAYEGESDREAAERHVEGTNGSLEAARKAVQRHRMMALERLLLQYLTDQRQAVA